MNKEERVLQYIEANPECTKTMVENNTDMYEKTARKILNKLIENNEVICEVDKVNPRIHHLHINNVRRSVIKTQDLHLSETDEKIKKQSYTSVQLLGGDWLTVPTDNPKFSNLVLSDFVIRHAK